MDLFDFTDNKSKAAPLSDRMRPTSLDEFIGQRHILSANSLLRRAILADKLGSCIFFGPPGVGKTTLASIIAAETKGDFVKMNAVLSGVTDAKRVIDQARDRLKMYGKRTYLLLDECHRWNKAQSDCVLSAIEDGSIIFIGSTTENPNIAMTRAIVSRCRIFELKPLSDEDIATGLLRAVADKERGLGNLQVELTEDGLKRLVWASSGDLRNALNALELAALTTPATAEGKIIINGEVAAQSAQKKGISIDESGYYDMLSAFCKSLRGSDADAALYWAFRLIASGIDPKIIFRRMFAHASEDVGLADTGALLAVNAAYNAYEAMGFPEGKLSLTHAIIYICTSPKSNSVVVAMNRAEEAVEKIADSFVPLHLRNNNNSSLDKPDEGYLYPHDFGGYVAQQYLPSNVRGGFYTPSQNGKEREIAERLKDFRKKAEDAKK